MRTSSHRLKRRVNTSTRARQNILPDFGGFISDTKDILVLILLILVIISLN